MVQTYADPEDPGWEHVDPYVRSIALDSMGHRRWHEVDSSNIRAIGWDLDGLWVQFNRGHVYLYTGVPDFMLERMLAIPSRGPTPDTSKGKFLLAYIIPQFAAVGPL